ncbi:hypothetical protein WME76_32660 [Sorangium sp. So ce119]|uniref:hypothetical protein n=1 Tax=Sorangium sp. So ce119 TaxID=3133279 RepID=UPI003F610C5E
MVTIACVRCPNISTAKELDEEFGFAVCRSCGTVFEVAAARTREVREENPWLRPPRELPAPPSYTVSATDVNPKDYRGHVKRELEMSWPVDDIRIPRWASVFFASLMWPITGYAAHAALQYEGPDPELLLGAMAPCVPLALFTAYLMFIAFASRTHLTIKSGTLQLRQRPRIPWYSDIDLKTEDIDKLFCARHISGRHKGTVCFSLSARLRSGKVLPLVPRMHGVKAAMFLQQRLKEALELPSETSVSAASLLDDIERVEAERARRGVPRGDSLIDNQG